MVRNGLVRIGGDGISARVRRASKLLVQFSVQGQLEGGRGCASSPLAFGMTQQFLRSSFPLQGTPPRNANALLSSLFLVACRVSQRRDFHVLSLVLQKRTA